ncbi:MAG: protease modulator HflC [Acidobacteriota bacterium]
MRAPLILFGSLILFLVLTSSLYVVDEREQVIITQFGEPIGDAVSTAGLHLKLPFIQKVHRFDRRFLEWDGQTNEVPTLDKRFIIVDTYARWRITDPLRFFERLKDEDGARRRIDDIIDGETRNALAKQNLVEVVRTTVGREALPDESEPEAENRLEVIELGREGIRQQILANTQDRSQGLGIEILDVQFKRLNYREEVRRQVENRMIAERQSIAARFRSEGEGEARNILGRKTFELNQILSEANRQAEEIRGTADAEATRIYAEAYNRNSDTREFFALLRSLEAYRTSIDESTTLVLSTDSDFFSYLEDGGR